MAWIYLLLAGIFEIGWPIGLKMAQFQGVSKYFWLLFAILTMTLSGILLFFAQKQIPIGTAYSIWTGIGTIETFFIGIFFFHDTLTLLKFFAVILILSGIIILKITH